jgi:hypothetical protein
MIMLLADWVFGAPSGKIILRGELERGRLTAKRYRSPFYENLLFLIERNLLVDRAFGSVSGLPGEVPVAGTNGLRSEDLLNPRNDFQFPTPSWPFNAILHSPI